jgi:hypothetical protein
MCSMRSNGVVQAAFRRRRHHARRPPFAKIKAGNPAPKTGPGTVDVGGVGGGRVGRLPQKKAEWSVSVDAGCVKLVYRPTDLHELAIFFWQRIGPHVLVAGLRRSGELQARLWPRQLPTRILQTVRHYHLVPRWRRVPSARW